MVVAIVLAYLVACLALGLAAGRKSSDTATGYVAGDRTLGLVLMYFITGATIFSAYAFLGAPGWAYSRGVAIFYLLAYGVVGFLPFYFLGPRAARLGRKHGFVTQAEMVAARFHMPSIAGLMALVSVVAFVPYLALQMKGAGYVLEAVTHGAIPAALGGALVYGVVTIYVLGSGVMGVGWTNTFQGIFMMGLAWFLGLYLPWKLYGGVGEMFELIAERRPELLEAPGLAKGGKTQWQWGEYTSAIIVSAVGFSVWPHLFMKAFTAKDDKTIRRTVVLYPTFQLFLIPLLLVGFAGILFTPAPARADQILPHILMHLDVPAVVVGLFCAGALAASMSSGDAIAHATAAIVVRDGIVVAGGRTLNPEAQRKTMRRVLIAVMVGAYLVAVAYEGSLVLLLLAAYGAVVQFAPVIVATLYLKRVTGLGILAGLVSGSLVTVAFVIAPGLRPWPVHAGLYGLVINTVMLLSVSRYGPQRPNAWDPPGG